MPTQEIRVTGYVQGVGFRSYVFQTAVTNGVRGETWNGRDGAVHVIAQHDDEAVLKRFEEEMWTGPGRVDGVRVEGAIEGNYAGFEISAAR